MQPCIHHALLTDDILHAIFQQFQLDQWHPPVPTLSSLRDIDPSQTENERLRCLARSARVCTSFRDAALPVLWGTLYDLVPFLRLFSSCVITHNLTGRVGPRGTHPGPYTFRLDSSYVPQAELQRIMYYGAMVQAVGKHCGYRYQSPQITLYNHRADPASWMHLQGALNGDPKQCLLPNIRRLSVQVFSVPDLDLVSTIASPSLLDLELVDFSHPNDNPSEGWQHVLDERIPVFLAAAPNLERFLLSFRAGPHISNKIASAVSQITSLRILDLRAPPKRDEATVGPTDATVFYNEPRISKLPPQFGISLSAVRTLATNCPHLEQLEIPLLDMQPHRVGPMETYPLLNHQLQRFEVCDMYIGDYSTAACIIDRMFPNVDVMVPLADISELNVEMRPLDWDDTTEMTWAWWKITAQYGLYLGIAMCQDGRSRDPWLRLEH
ncbi:hypothetical protein FKP32DRAFT_1682952 [Trametes sanguinea]|nr:hypothetical protein FKP32DRAFT_1682952 [Trametes sanguinea]